MLLGVAGGGSAPGPRGGSGLLARLRHGEAAGSLPPGGRRGAAKGGPGGAALRASERAREGGREGAEGPAGAPVRQLFRPSPEPARGLPLARPGPPLPAGCWLRPQLQRPGAEAEHPRPRGLRPEVLPASQDSGLPEVAGRRGCRSQGSSFDLPGLSFQLCNGRAGPGRGPAAPRPFSLNRSCSGAHHFSSGNM